jgi:hypothetical protein
MDTDDTPESRPDLASLLNVGTAFEYKGKEYRLKELDLPQKARYAQWLRDRALAAYTAGAANDAPDHVRRELLRVYGIDCAAGVYDFGGEACVKSLGTLAGQAQVLHLSLSPDNPEVTPEFAAEMLQAKYAEIINVLLEAAAPKSAAPAASAGAHS